MQKEELVISNSWKVIKARQACFDNSSFTQTGAMNMYFEDVSLVGTKILNANLSNLEIKNAQMGGACFSDIGVPEEGDIHYNPETAGKPIQFENCDLKGTIISNSNLSNVEIQNCNIQGLRINGINIEELLAIVSEMKKE